jgi:hypothetical protein
MAFLKYITPFIWLFPVCIYLAFKTWSGAFIPYNLVPGRAVLFVSIGFTMIIADLFTKYLVGKQKLGYVWLIEAILLGILAVMLVPKINEVTGG